MRAQVEHIEPSPRESWAYQFRSEPAFPFHWHFHQQLELTLIISGRGVRFVGDCCEDYGPGDLVLLGSELPHSYLAEPHPDGVPNTAIVAQFDREFLGAGFLAAPEFGPLVRLFDRASRGLSFDPAAAGAVAGRLAELGGLTGAARTVELLRVLTELAALPARPLVSEGFRALVDENSQAMIERICTFLITNHRARLSLADVAAVAHLTPSALSRSFRRATGRSVLNYLIEVRIAVACRLLIDTDRTIAEIAADSGYASLANFNRQFRRLKGMAPREFRAAYGPGGETTVSP